MAGRQTSVVGVSSEILRRGDAAGSGVGVQTINQRPVVGHSRLYG